MQLRRLGRTNLRVSVIGLGTNQLRRVPVRQAIETCKRAFELGVNLVNAEPEYEGAFEILRKAIDDSPSNGPIYLSVQAGGNRDQFERALDNTCAAFNRSHIDLFGITAISDQEAFGANVWGPGGLVELLQQWKQAGRIGAIFGSDHGSPEQMKVIIERNVFDALMLAYNPIGHHLVTYRAKTVWKFETPPVPISNYEREDLRRTRTEILPLASRDDIGILLMKPLAGGLLCQGTAFPNHHYRQDFPTLPSPAEILRYLLETEPITAVIPGMACIEEVEENVRAGEPIPTLDIVRIESQCSQLGSVLCSRCGECDDLCSQGLPISYLFRAAYHYLYPNAPFGVSNTLQYFRLHPWEQARCETCTNQTCRCLSGIDIPRELTGIHRKMLELRAAGIVPAADTGSEDFATGLPLSAKLLSFDATSGNAILHIRNTGTQPWTAGFPLKVELDGAHFSSPLLRQSVAPRGDGHYVFPLPLSAGPHTLSLSLGGFWSDELRFEPGRPYPFRRPSHPYRARYIEHNTATAYLCGSRVVFRILVENSGTETWFSDPPDGHYAGLCFFVNGQFAAVGRPSPPSVPPGVRTEIAITAQIPDIPATYSFRFDMAICNKLWFADAGSTPLEFGVEVSARPQTPTDRLLDISYRRNHSYFSPGMSVYRSNGKPSFPVFAESARGCVLTYRFTGWNPCIAFVLHRGATDRGKCL
jgi:predicted aldo/keto reductase-like oxidoreductase